MSRGVKSQAETKAKTKPKPEKRFASVIPRLIDTIDRLGSKFRKVLGFIYICISHAAASMQLRACIFEKLNHNCLSSNSRTVRFGAVKPKDSKNDKCPQKLYYHYAMKPTISTLVMALKSLAATKHIVREIRAKCMFIQNNSFWRTDSLTGKSHILYEFRLWEGASFR